MFLYYVIINKEYFALRIDYLKLILFEFIYIYFINYLKLILFAFIYIYFVHIAFEINFNLLLLLDLF